uniref:Uncharacterized protein n=1 Tax=Rhizophora mucronata TaxID=61149 RepID=A0A2P2QXU9_RHIMU
MSPNIYNTLEVAVRGKGASGSSDPRSSSLSSSFSCTSSI